MRTALRTAAVVAVVLAFQGAAAAWASGDGMPWRSPEKVPNGDPVDVASIRPCPPPPTPGDSVLVQVFLALGPSGGGSTQIIPARAGGEWSGDVTFAFSGVRLRRTTISATCEDFNGVTSFPYAQYEVHHTRLVP